MIITHKLLKEQARYNHRWGGSYGQVYREVLDDVFTPYAWPGRSPIEFSTECELLCHNCAKERFLTHDYDSDEGIYSGIYWEGPAHTCDSCGYVIESAYGEVEEDD